MTNAQVRVVSGVVMAIIVLLCLAFDRLYAVLLVGIAGVLLTDEIFVNLLKESRKTFAYLVNLFVFIVGFLYFNFLDDPKIYAIHFINGAFFINGCLLFNLFRGRNSKNSKAIIILRAMSFLIGLFTLILMMNVVTILQTAHWQKAILLLIVINFSVDTFAWYFGRKFGITKLMPTVSPKKTREGAAGGILVSILLGSILWYVAWDEINLSVTVGLVFISLFSQLGDLIQSKLKRQCDVKDSSNLIPGHGGIYDRLDSLLFVAPIYLYILIYN